jgi:tetratricopeptide (TPR) repeat protein
MKRCSFTGFLAFALIIAIFFAQTIKADYKQAVAYYNQGRFEQAIQELKADLDQNSEWEAGHRLLGLCYLGLKNNALAVSAFLRAIQLKSTAFSTYCGLGQAYFNMQKYDNCVTALNQAEPFAAKEKEPEKERAILFKFRGSAYYQMGKYNEAVNDLTNAIRVNQSDWTDFFKLGFCYFQLSRIDESIQALEKALSMKPGESRTTDLLGNAYLRKANGAIEGKQYAAAVPILLKARDYAPKNGYIYYNLAEVYLFQKKYPEAEKALNQAADLIPRSLEVSWRMGFVYEKQKKWDLALKAYNKAGEIKMSKEIKEAIARVNENMKK